MRYRHMLFTTACAALIAATAPISIAAERQPAINEQVQQGVDAWKAGDFDAAVRAWMPVATSGNADAQFNMGQAYKLGRGVITSLADAEIWYRRAADQGHLQAEDNLGLILFTMGQREAAMPYIRRSADRGEARAQFLLGTAHYNGDLAEKNWPRAYALITRASETGLSLAKARITDLDRLIPADQRQQGLALLPAMRKAEEQSRLAALPASEAPIEADKPAPAPTNSVRTSVAPPAPVQMIELPPSNLSANLDAATQSDTSPAEPRPTPGITFTPPAQAAPAPAAPTAKAVEPAASPAVTPLALPQTAPAPKPEPTAKPVEAPVLVAAPPPQSKPAPKAAPAQPAARATGTSRWRAQLGAFSVAENARTMWKKLSGQYPELRRHSPQYVLSNSGRITRLVIGGFDSQSQAASMCANLRRAGETCLVTSD